MTEAELRTGSEPTDASARQRDLLRTPRWAWLAAFIDTWYFDPVTAQDASPTEEIDAAATAPGVDLPQALREWFELVGRRLEWVQDLPARSPTCACTVACWCRGLRTKAAGDC